MCVGMNERTYRNTNIRGIDMTQNEITTSDFSKFGYRERKIAKELLQAWEDQGLPSDFNDDEVTIMMNRNSGNVFLTNSDFQVAMMNGDKLESFYNTPYEGHEGFLEELLLLINDDSTHEEDKEYIREIVKERE